MTSIGVDCRRKGVASTRSMSQTATRATGRPALRAPTTTVDAAIVIGLLIAFATIAVRRPVDVDEGSYLLAAKLALDGVVPYSDFLYVQMPLLPYVYGAWTLLVGESWVGVRILSACFATALGALLYRDLAMRFGRRLGGLGLALFVASPLVFTWYATVKTYALSTLLLFGAYVLVLRGTSANRLRWLGAGALTALAIDTRLIFAVVLPALVWAAWRVQANGRSQRMAALGGGLLVGLAPAFFFFVLDPSRFVFDNLGYHGARNPEGLFANLDQKLEVAAGMLGFAPYLLLLLGALVAGIVLHRLEGRVPLSVLLGASLFAGSLAPTPTYDQYFCTTVPFLAVASVEVVAAIRDRPAVKTDAVLRLFAWSATAITLAIYIGSGAYNLVSLVGSTSRTFARIDSVERVATIVDERTRPGEQVLTSWPGYLFGTHARPVPGTENDFAADARSSSRLKRQLGIGWRRAMSSRAISASDGRASSRSKIWHLLPPTLVLDQLAQRSGYRLVADVDSVRIYELPRR